ncbi:MULTISPECIES: ParA family protein [unclassified Pseudoalteromonas]|uniref:ParA family protein n=1 Tax=unclassified Pseudoalteromonas TaxID=194690 RepID=UPI00041829A6|nr:MULTISPECIES: ParA family protein [unclassified Pseudoalteromonas]
MKNKKPISLMIYNHKGGVGKSTIAGWLAYLFATGGIEGKDKKLNIALVDLDSQQNASKTFLKMKKMSGVPYLLPPRHPDFIEGSEDNGSWNGFSTSSDILFNRQFVYYPVTGIDTLKILPSEGRVDRLSEVKDNDDFIPLIADLAQDFLDVEAEMDEIDIIIYDTPPSKTSICEGFLSKCSHVLVPTQLEYDSVDSVPQLMDNIRIYNEERDIPIEIVGVVPNLASSTSLTKNEVEQYGLLEQHIEKYKTQNNIDIDLLPKNFFLVNRTIFKPVRKPDELEKVFCLKKDKKATLEMSNLYSFVRNRLGVDHD